MGIVIDEYGGSDGLISIEDLVEEIVGDISDEHDTDDEQLIKRQDDNIYVADARVQISVVDKLLGVDLLSDEEEDEADTLGGLIFEMAGKVPTRGEIIKHDSGLEFEILQSDARRVKRIRIHVKKQEAPRGGSVEDRHAAEEAERLKQARFFRIVPEIDFRPRAHVGNDFGGGEAAQLGRAGIAKALGVAEEKASGVEIAGARYIHHLRNGDGRNHQNVITMGHDTAQGRAGDNGDFTILAQRLQGPVKILRQVERLDFGFIGKDDIDVIPDEFEKAFAVALDAKGIGERD